MAQTSNRDIVFELAQKNIEANRYTGYGIFHTIGDLDILIISF